MNTIQLPSPVVIEAPGSKWHAALDNKILGTYPTATEAQHAANLAYVQTVGPVLLNLARELSDARRAIERARGALSEADALGEFVQAYSMTAVPGSPSARRAWQSVQQARAFLASEFKLLEDR